MSSRLEKPRQAPEQCDRRSSNDDPNSRERSHKYSRASEGPDGLRSRREKATENTAATEDKAQIQPAVPENFSASRTNPTLNVLPGSDPSLFGTERDTLHCAFYLKTGACRFGPSCSKAHPYPVSSPVILLRNFYAPLYGALKREVQLDEDEDEDLEIDEGEAYSHFLEFYADTVPELRQFGEIVQLKVCRNHAPHLCGNVYVQYLSDEDAMRAIRSLNGRFYAGRAISTELSPVTHWKTAVCGLFDKNQCPRGRQCNFLHVFRNPNGEYDLPREAERRERGAEERGHHRREHREHDPRRDHQHREPHDPRRAHEAHEPYDAHHTSQHQHHRGERVRHRADERDHVPHDHPLSRERDHGHSRERHYERRESEYRQRAHEHHDPRRTHEAREPYEAQHAQQHQHRKRTREHDEHAHDERKKHKR